MQPGNNYRAAASLIEEAMTQDTIYIDQPVTPQEHADALSAWWWTAKRWTQNGNYNSYSCPRTWSPMLTVWRKLHVETDTMVRPTFAQNTFSTVWDEPIQGPAQTQVVVEIVDVPAGFPGGFQSEDDQLNDGYVELKDTAGNVVVIAGIVGYTTDESQIFGDTDTKDEVKINIPDCGNGVSRLECLGGATLGTGRLSDDDLSVEATFTAKTWGCDDLYAGPVGSLLPPDLSALQLRYHPAYIDPVQDMATSNVQGLVSFLRNQGFGYTANWGKALWDQAKAARNLPVSVVDFWTVMVVSAWQAEETDDNDPNTEVGAGEGLTLGINTHGDGATTALSELGSTYTGICTVFKAIFLGEVGFGGREQHTVGHEVGHTFGLPHNNLNPGDPPIGMMDRFGTGQTLPLIAQNLRRLREYSGP